MSHFILCTFIQDKTVYLIKKHQLFRYLISDIHLLVYGNIYSSITCLRQIHFFDTMQPLINVHTLIV